VQATKIGSPAAAALRKRSRLTAFDHHAVTAGALYRPGIERHAVFAGTDQDIARPFGHLAVLPLYQAEIAGLVSGPSEA